MQIANYAKVVLSRTKIDIVDAKLIADFGRTEQPKPWQPEAEHVRTMRSLTRHIDALIKIRTQEEN